MQFIIFLFTVVNSVFFAEAWTEPGNNAGELNEFCQAPWDGWRTCQTLIWPQPAGQWTESHGGILGDWYLEMDLERWVYEPDAWYNSYIYRIDGFEEGKTCWKKTTGGCLWCWSEQCSTSYQVKNSLDVTVVNEATMSVGAKLLKAVGLKINAKTTQTVAESVEETQSITCGAGYGEYVEIKTSNQVMNATIAYVDALCKYYGSQILCRFNKDIKLVQASYPIRTAVNYLCMNNVAAEKVGIDLNCQRPSDQAQCIDNSKLKVRSGGFRSEFDPIIWDINA